MFRPLPPFIKIGKSNIEGDGLIAKEDIPAHLDVGLFHWYVRKGLIIRTPLGGFCNHSVTPNCSKVQFNKNEFYLLTEKKIKKGEELTIEYDLYKP